MSYRFPSFRLLQFAKAPSASVKTRLAPVLNVEQRIALHCEMTEWVSGNLQSSTLAPVQLWLNGDDQHGAFANVPSVFQQRGQDLGERLLHAFKASFKGAEAVVVVGSDCPFIDKSYLTRALECLAQGRSIVIGPANDGGYVLLGMRELAEDLFSGIDWGSDRVFAQTLSKIKSAGLTYQVLESLADIDRPADLSLLNDDQLPPSLRAFSQLPSPKS